MMPFIQGDPESVPIEYRNGYERAIEIMATEPGKIGYLTIDESTAKAGIPHRGDRAKHGRAIHTEAGIATGRVHCWGGRDAVTLERDARVLIANSLDRSCAVWNAEHEDTTDDGDIGHAAEQYPLSQAHMMAAGEVLDIGILTPHESLPVRRDVQRQFIRVVSSGVHGREPYFTRNRLMATKVRDWMGSNDCATAKSTKDGDASRMPNVLVQPATLRIEPGH